MNGMKTPGLCWLLALMMPLSASAQGYWKPVSQADAVQLIRNFEGDQTLQPAMQPLNFDMAVTSPHGGLLRKFECGIYEYSLDCFSNDFVWRTDNRWGNNVLFYGHTDIDTLAPTAMSQANAQQIAQSFMASHFAEPNKLALIETRPEINLQNFIGSYNFIFGQDVGNGVRGPASCEVEIDTIYGRVIWYMGTNRPILSLTVPSLTADQAAAKALVAFAPNGSGHVNAMESIGLTDPDAFGNETISYSIILSNPSVRVSVDGFTGQILDHMELAGISKPNLKAKELTRRGYLVPTSSLDLLLVSTGSNRPYMSCRPPVSVGDQAYLPADYLRGGDRAAKVTWAADHKSYSLVTPRHQLAFTIGQKQYTLDGNKQSLKHSPAVVLDQPYVPLELAKKLMPYHLTYLAATKTVHFEPIASKTGSTTPAVVPVSAH